MSDLKNVTQFLSSTGKRNLALEIINHFFNYADDIFKIRELSEAYFYSHEYSKSLDCLNILLKKDIGFDQKNDVLINIANIKILINEPKEALEILDKLPENYQVMKLKQEAKKNLEVNKFVDNTGYWKSEISEVHECSLELAKWISEFLPKDKLIHDFGCGNGNYLKYLKDNYFEKLIGYEGEIPNSKVFDNIIQQNLTDEFKVEKGNVICLEVGEHIPKEYQDVFLNNICNACNDKLILSWAIRGQTGLLHVNCLNYDEVKPLIEMRGFKLLEKESLNSRACINFSCDWFKNTLYIFQKI